MTYADFIRAIAGRPGDDAPRLVYADWLEERDGPGDAERAAFIRRSQPPPMRGRTREVLRWHRYAAGLLAGIIPRTWPVWVLNHPDPARPDAPESFPAAVSITLFSASRPPFVVALRHGFVCAVATSSRRFFKVAPALFARQPVQDVVLTDACPDDLHGRRVWWLSPSPRRDLFDWLLPPCLFHELPGRERDGRAGWPNVRHKVYGTSGEAYEALSAACVRYGRRACAAPAGDVAG